ncbi:dephospho-CoA kinase [Alkanindiges sp. WGS2144]|uniref:dephospho-CoA kinase n=1 Tax=Alkanindiges sp. WGS2144 TaxID=3366808 RepID=UPI0037511032
MAAFIVGLTGGIGSGKTAASDWFAAQGITVVDADVVAREVVEPGQPALQEIQQAFGHWVLQADGALNRVALRQHIFEQPQARIELEKITHPRIRQRIMQQLQAASSPYRILVSPLLIESGQHDLVNRVLLIDVPEHLQLSRASLRDTQSPEAIARIMQVQMPRLQRQTHADDIVVNDGELRHLYAQLQPLHQTYLKLAQGS